MRAVQSRGTMPLSSPCSAGLLQNPQRALGHGAAANLPRHQPGPGSLAASVPQGPGRAWHSRGGPYTRCRGLSGKATEHRAILSKAPLGAAPAPFGEPWMVGTFVGHIGSESPWGLSERVGSIYLTKGICSVLGGKGASHGFLQFLPQRNERLEFLPRIHRRPHVKCSVRTLCSHFCTGSNNSADAREEIGHFTLCPSSLLFIKNTAFLPRMAIQLF